jgi:hypothetical protein
MPSLIDIYASHAHDTMQLCELALHLYVRHQFPVAGHIHDDTCDVKVAPSTSHIVTSCCRITASSVCLPLPMIVNEAAATLSLIRIT